MATSRSSRKRIRQNRRRNLYNRGVKSSVKTGIKRFLEAVEAKNVETAKKEFVAAVAELDRAGTKRILHPNTVSRRKSALALKLNALSAAGK